MVSFRTLGQKKVAPVVAPPIIQVPLPTVDPILAMVDAVMGGGPSSSEAPLLDKHKGNELTMGLS